jgi:hypothetical protein
MSSARSTTDHRAATAPRERRSPQQPTQDGNPFAPPPEDAPARPWQPRRPRSEDDRSDAGDRSSGPESGTAPGSQWGSRQPDRQEGGLGRRPGLGSGSSPPGSGPRFDPTDPAQRRARYALLSGMWGLFCAALLGWTSAAMLLGALALYWGVSSLRMKPEERAKARAATTAALSGGQPVPPAAAATEDDRPQRTAAVSGIVTGSLALALVATAFTAQFVYRDYYTCTRDALTAESHQDCVNLLPAPLRSMLSEPQ